MTSFFVTSYCLLFFFRWQCQCHTNTDMGGPDNESADNSSVKKHQETLRILTSCYHGTTYAYVLRWFYRIHGKSRKNLEWFPCKEDANSATWTKFFRLRGLLLKKKPEVLFMKWPKKKVRHKTFGVQFIYGASGSFFMLFWVLPDSGIIQ